MKILFENRPAIIIDNDAVLITGDNLLQTFDRFNLSLLEGELTGDGVVPQDG